MNVKAEEYFEKFCNALTIPLMSQIEKQIENSIEILQILKQVLDEFVVGKDAEAEDFYLYKLEELAAKIKVIK